MTTRAGVDDLQAHALALLIKRAVHAGGRGWCSTQPLTIARYLLAAGVTLPPPPEGVKP